MSQTIEEPPDQALSHPEPAVAAHRIGHWRRGAYVISSDIDRIDFDVVHGFLRTAHWSPGIPRATVERAARHSLPFGLYHDPAGGSGADRPGSAQIGPAQIGYARVLTDHVAMAYLMDVFVLAPHRGQGLARWLVETILAQPDLRDVRAWLLRSRDATGLYEKLGFEPLVDGGHYRRYSRHPGYPQGRR